MKKLLLASLLFTFSYLASAEAETLVEDSGKAQRQYMINCQGCHLADGSGLQGSVPSMKDFVGNFLGVKGGREFLVQVPGSANSSLSDKDLANLLNWILATMSTKQLDDKFEPYTELEVSTLRPTLLVEVDRIRAELVAKF